MDKMSEDYGDSTSMHLDALEESLGVTIKDREGFMEAFRGLVASCSGEGNHGEDEDEDEDQGKRKGMPGIAVILGKGK